MQVVEPIKPLTRQLYHCGPSFELTMLKGMLAAEGDPFGFIVMDGNGALFAKVVGSQCSILHRFQVSLPNKHGRGGQSSVRFARLAEESRRNYVRKVAECATHVFLSASGDAKPIVRGLVVAGAANLKSALVDANALDQRLRAIIVAVLDVSYGGASGLREAIALAGPTLRSSELTKEVELVRGFFNQVARDTGRTCYGLRESFEALELGAVEQLLVWDQLSARRVEVRDVADGTVHVLVASSSGQEQKAVEAAGFSIGSGGHNAKQKQEQEGAQGGGNKKSKGRGTVEIISSVSLLEWLVDTYAGGTMSSSSSSSSSVTIRLVTDTTPEGAQFVAGFGGLGGLLRYKMDLTNMIGRSDHHHHDPEVDGDDDVDSDDDATDPDSAFV